MSESSHDYLTLLRLPDGRLVFAAVKTGSLADEAREPGLKELAGRVVAQGKKALRLQREWDNGKSTRTKARGNASAVDVEFDEGWVAFDAAVKGQLFGPADRPQRVAAEAVRAAVFAKGPSALTQPAFEMQLSLSDEALDALETPPLAAHVQLLGLGEHVTTLRGIAERFRAELQKQPKGVTWNDVLAARLEAQELYAGMIFNILGRYPGTDPAAVARREELLSEVNRQNEILSDLYRRHRPQTDVHPDTGEDIGDEPVPEPAVEPAA